MEQLKYAFNFQKFVFVMSNQPLSSCSSDTASDRGEITLNEVQNDLEEVASQPKSMIKPAFINQIQVADPDSE